MALRSFEYRPLLCNPEKEDTHVFHDDRTLGVPVEYTGTLEKAYHFFKDGHVQEVKYHSMPKQNDHICVVSKVLPSMKKDRVYNVVIVICESNYQGFHSILCLSSRTCRVLQPHNSYIILSQGLYSSAFI